MSWCCSHNVGCHPEIARKERKRKKISKKKKTKHKDIANSEDEQHDFQGKHSNFDDDFK